MDKPAPTAEQFHVSPLKAAIIAVVVVGGIALGTWLTLPKMEERGRAQARISRPSVEQGGASAPLILDGDFVWVAGGASAGFWIGRYPVGREEFDAFAAATGGVTAAVSDADAGRAVVRVTASVARQYCDWLTRGTGISHRLPGDDEWTRLVGAASGEGSPRANASGIQPSRQREWVGLTDGTVVLRPPGDAAESGAFRVIRAGTPPAR